MGKHSQSFPSFGMLKKVKPFPQKNPIYGILGDIHFPIFSHRRNFMSQVSSVINQRTEFFHTRMSFSKEKRRDSLVDRMVQKSRDYSA